MPGGIQFYGVESVIAAYELNKVPNWGLFCGKQFQFKYDEGEDMEAGSEKLKAILTRLAEVKTSNTYTLCVYEDLQAGEKIKNTTPFDGSFNFRVNEEDQFLAANGNYSKKLDERLSGIENRLNREEDEPQSEVGGVMGVIGKLLEKPEIQTYIFTKVFAFMDKILPDNPQTKILPAAAISGVPDNASDVQKIQSALAVLMEIDPRLGDNLVKVAAMAKANPAKYELLISML